MGRFLKIIYKDTGKIVDFWSRGKETLGNCTRCGRFCYLDKHHLVTQSRGGTKTVKICRACHTWIGLNINKAEKEGFYLRGYKNDKD